MHLLAIGLNHTTAPVSVRERVAFGPEEIAETIGHMRERFSSTQMGGIHEAAILSTCNRTEIYCAAEDTDAARDSVLGFICERKNVSRSELEPHIYTFTQEEAAKHTFRVASGLDSMVLGETQIVGQMKKAEKMARDAHGLGTMLNHLFQSTFTVAKEVRTATAIGANSVSLAAAAVRLALRLFGSLKDERVLFVGAGEMIELCAAHFAAQQPKSITIANRTLERGQVLARTVHADAIRLADLPEKIAGYDIIVSCTASALPIIGLGMIERAINERKHRPMFIVDLAVPRDVEPEIDRLDDVYVYTVDDLGKVVNQGMASRQAAITQAETIISLRMSDSASARPSPSFSRFATEHTFLPKPSSRAPCATSITATAPRRSCRCSPTASPTSSRTIRRSCCATARASTTRTAISWSACSTASTAVTTAEADNPDTPRGTCGFLLFF